MRVTNGDVSHWVLLSSYFILNNVPRPELNLCEIAAGYYDR